METINSIILAFQAIIAIGLGLRIVYCCVKMQTNPNELEDYKQRIKNTIQIGIVVAIISGLKILLESYYKGG